MTEPFDSKKSRPNILWICTDQLRYDSLGCTGNPHAVTPNLDELAAEGAVFSRFITVNPVCMPSRASFFTGQLPSRHGVVTNGIPLANRELTPKAPPYGKHPPESHAKILPELLLNSGYHTRSIGKLHLCPTQASPDCKHPENHWLWKDGCFDDWHGPYFGFEHVELTLHHGESTMGGHYRKWLRESAPEVEQALQSVAENQTIPELDDVYPGRIPEELHHSTWVGERTVDFLSSPQAREKPFFLWMSFPDPHHPFTPPKALAEEFSKHEYVTPTAQAEDLQSKPTGWPQKALDFLDQQPERIGPIRQYTDAQNHLVDRAIGLAIQALKDNGLWDDTVILFTSDHGDFLGEYGLLRKADLPCNALNHVPFILRDPSGKTPQTTGMTISSVDIFPTICELSGIPVPEDLDGQSLLKGVPEERKALVQCMGVDEPRSFTLYDHQYRLSWYPDLDEWECYDHNVDPYERQNIISDLENTPRFSELRNYLLQRHMEAFSLNSGRLSCW